MIFNFNQFLNERHGVSNASIVLLDYLTNYVFYEMEEFFKSDENYFELDKTLDYSIFKDIITKDQKELYKQFEIRKFDINIKFNRKSKLTKKGVPVKDIMTAVAYPFEFGKGYDAKIKDLKDELKKTEKMLENEDYWDESKMMDSLEDLKSQLEDKIQCLLFSSIIKSGEKTHLELKFDVSVDIVESVKWEKNKNDIYIEMESVISHELNHLYEFFELSKNNKNFNYGLAAAADYKNPILNNKTINFLYGHLLYYIYCVNPTEINAETQEAWSYTKRYSFEEMKKKWSFWIEIENMINFNSEKEFNKLNNIIKYETGRDIKSTYSIILKGFLEKYKEILNDWNEKPNISISKLETIVKNGDMLGFFKLFEKIIKRGGLKLKHNIIKQYE